MKKCIKMIFITILMLPIILHAGIYTYDDAQEVAEEYRNSFSDSNIYFMDKGGFISKEEYEISVKNTTSSYLFNGYEYWTSTASTGNNYYVLGEDIFERSTNDTAYVKVKENVKADIKVTGTGTTNDPWEFIPRYNVKVKTNNSLYGLLNSKELIEEIVDKGKSLPITLNPEIGYEYKTDNCGDTTYSNNELKINYVYNDIDCKVTFDKATYKVIIVSNGATSQANPNVLYLKYKDEWYTNTNNTDMLDNNKLKSTPTRVGYTFNGCYTKENGAGDEVIDKDGNLISATDASEIINKNSSIYTDWTANTYIVTLDANGATSAGTTQITATYDSNLPKLEEVPKKVYTVTLDYNGNGESDKKLTSSYTFNGYYYNNTKYYNGDGTSAKKWDIASNVTLKGYWSNEGINLEVPKKTGYTFTGWYTSASGGNLISMGDEAYVPTSNIILYARWTANSYKINYALNSGTAGTYAPTSATYDSVVRISNPTRAGYAFAGWTVTSGLNTSTAKYGTSSSSVTNSLSSDSTKVKSEYFKNLTATNNGSVTLTANWTPYYVIINFKHVEGTLTSTTTSGNTKYNWTTSDSLIYLNGSILTHKLKYGASLSSSGLVNYNNSSYLKITRTGYSAVSNSEWKCLSGNCNKSTYSHATVYSASDFCDNSTSDCTVTLGVNWKANTYTVTLNGNGATTAGTTSVSATYDSAMPTITVPQRKYTVTQNYNGNGSSDSKLTSTYTFNGYYYNNTKYYNGDGTSARTWNVASDTTLTANWTSKSVTLGTPTRTGYSFKGWYTAASGGTFVGAGGASYTPTSDITLYAQWDPYYVTINFKIDTDNEKLTSQTKNSAGTTTYNWTTKDDYIYKNNSILVQKLKYNTSLGTDGLVNYNNSTYLKITRTGYTGVSNSEWKCLSGNCNKSTYSHATAYSASDFCDNSTSNCTVTLGVNWKANTYTINYDLAGGTAGTYAPTSATYDSTLRVSNVTKVGYTFAGWTVTSGLNTSTAKYGTSTSSVTSSISSSSTKIKNEYFKNLTATNNGSVTLTANWTPNTNTAYKVQHWQQKVGAATTQNSTNYTLAETENKTGTTGASITPAVKTYTGFTSPSTQTTTILANGSRVVNYYYTRKSYTVTLTKGTGISSVSGAGTYQYGATVTLGATASAGYTWSKWTGYATSTTKAYSFTMPAQNVSFTANSTPNTYTVTFDTSCGTVSPTSKTVTYKSTYGTLPEPSLTGYSFNGWYTAASGGTKITSTSTVTSTANHTLYAQCSGYNAIINFKHVDGTLTSQTKNSSGTATYNWTTKDSLIYLNGTLLTHKLKYGASLSSSGLVNYNNSTYLNITRVGYSAVSNAEWKCLSGNCNKSTYSHSTVYTSTDFCDNSSSDCTVTLGVNWTPNTNTAYKVQHWQQKVGAAITQNSTNYTLAETENKTGTTGASITPAVKTTYAGFTAPSTQTTTILADGSRVVNYYYTRKSYTVTLTKGTGISSVTGAGTYQYGATVTLGATASAGYTWNNWTGYATTSTNAHSFTMPAQNVSFTANATANSYKVTFNANGGSVSTSSKTVTYKSTYGTLPNATRAGYSFNGWYTASSGGTKITSTTTVTTASNHTLYAQWTQCSSGKYNDGSSTTCSDCPTAYPNSSAGSTSIYSCYMNVSGGYYIKNAYDTSATKCAASTFKGSHTVYYSGTSTCSSCPTAYPNSSAGSSAVTNCYVSVSAGYYVSNSSGTITACPSGTYRSGTATVYYNNTNSCSNCNASYPYTASSGSDSATDCYMNVAAGKYLKTAYDSSSTSCSANTYSTQHNVFYGKTSSCTSCPSGSTSEAGSSSCTKYYNTTLLSNSVISSGTKFNTEYGDTNTSAGTVDDDASTNYTVTLPLSMDYIFQIWGAQGAPSAYLSDTYTSFRGGYGGFSTGTYSGSASKTLYVYVGSRGGYYTCSKGYSCDRTTSAAGYNGGGGVYLWYGKYGASTGAGGGGGATHIATKSGLLSSLSSYTSNILIVAGGGGGGALAYNAGYSDCSCSYSYCSRSGGDAGGYWGEYGSGSCYGLGGGDYASDRNACSTYNTTFGKGGNTISNDDSYSYGGGGGGGYYGGGGGWGTQNIPGGGGGGSGYLNTSEISDAYMTTYGPYDSDSDDGPERKTIITSSVSVAPTVDYAKKNNGYARVTTSNGQGSVYTSGFYYKTQTSNNTFTITATGITANNISNYIKCDNSTTITLVSTNTTDGTITVKLTPSKDTICRLYK